MTLTIPSLEAQRPSMTVKTSSLDTSNSLKTAATPAPNNPPTSRLISLPPELRLHIYSHLFSNFHPQRDDASTLRTSRTIRHEAMHSYFKRVLQLLQNAQADYAAEEEAVTILRQRGDKILAAIRKMLANCALRPFKEWWARVKEGMERDEFPVSKWLLREKNKD